VNWSGVGSWIKDNAGTGTALVGSLLTGNVPGALAAGISLVSGATGTDDPAKALQILQGDSETMLKLKKMYYENEASVRNHLAEVKKLELEDAQKAHSEQQTTIREGDKATDEYVRRTRPTMARQSWYGTLFYVIGTEFAMFWGVGSGASMELAMVLLAPAGAYMGFRTWDKHHESKSKNLPQK